MCKCQLFFYNFEFCGLPDFFPFPFVFMVKNLIFLFKYSYQNTFGFASLVRIYIYQTDLTLLKRIYCSCTFCFMWGILQVKV